MGPDVRWIGTESGYGRETEWSVIPGRILNPDSVAVSQHQDPLDAAFAPGDLTNSDLGSREKLAGARDLIWYPAEVDVSIRPGWFYHSSEDNQVKTPAKLLDIYYSSVGRNAVLLLNIPPNQMGLIGDNDIRSLREMRRILNVTFRDNLAANATVTTSDQQPGHEGKCSVDGDQRTYWAARPDSTSATLEFDLQKERTFDVISLREFIQLGQRVESFVVDVWSNGIWRELIRGTTIGYNRLLRVPVATTAKVRLRITGSRLAPTLSEFGLYRQPPGVAIDPLGSAFTRNQEVRLVASSKDAKIRYTLDGKDPDINSAIYASPLVLRANTIVKAVAFLDDRTVGVTASANFRKARHLVSLRTQYSQKYPAGGPLALVDGLKGGAYYSDPAWQGYEGNDLSAIVDLQSTKTINSVSTGFLQDIGSWVFFPEYVEYSFSENGRNFGKSVKVTTDVPVNKEGSITSEFRANLPGMRARFVKVIARNIGTCPPGHPGAGQKAWIFVDEISIE
jgi:alpha-L-fucosidase